METEFYTTNPYRELQVHISVLLLHRFILEQIKPNMIHL